MSRPDGITALVTCQMRAGRGMNIVFPPGKSAYEVHLVRYRGRTATDIGGTPGPTLCGIERFGPGAPGWSMSGGVSGPNTIQLRCPGCTEVAHNDFRGLPISGEDSLAEPFREALRAYAGEGDSLPPSA